MRKVGRKEKLVRKYFMFVYRCRITKKECFRSKVRAKTEEEAWEKTLTKWKLIISGHRVVEGVPACGLCDLYHHERCKGCPVAEETGARFCEDTPFVVWLRTGGVEDARAEYAFLLNVKGRE